MKRRKNSFSKNLDSRIYQRKQFEKGPTGDITLYINQISMSELDSIVMRTIYFDQCSGETVE